VARSTPDEGPVDAVPAAPTYAHQGVFDALSLDPSSFKSVPGFPSVFVGEDGGRKVVVKRTRTPLARGRALLAWMGELRSTGALVVEPVTHLAANPVAVGDDVWVAYQYVDGEPYSDSSDRRSNAGRLLGAIHALDPGEHLHAAVYGWPIQDDASLDEDLTLLAALLEAQRLDMRLLTQYERKLRELEVAYVRPLKAADLSWALGPWDYKANNLVYIPGTERPVLIDPDSAGYLPRLLDLALAAILFHNDATQGPGRLFNQTEWSEFYSGYAEHIALSADERSLWPIALEFMRLEEGLWAVLNDDTGWASPGRQRDYLLDVLTSDLNELQQV
jgi:hypothetical protein